MESKCINSLPSSIDFCDIKGQAHVKRALEIAAAGRTTSSYLDRLDAVKR